MCVTKLFGTNECGGKDKTDLPSLVWENAEVPRAIQSDLLPRGNTRTSQYRVLRAAPPRGGPRSVDRDCAGRNATSVKDVEPRQSTHFRGGRARMDDRLNSGQAKATPVPLAGKGTTGVQDHGMYRRLMTEHKRSAPSRTEANRPWSRANGQGVMSKSGAILRAEVRCPHSSGEAGQLPWSEGGHGE